MKSNRKYTLTWHNDIKENGVAVLRIRSVFANRDDVTKRTKQIIDALNAVDLLPDELISALVDYRKTGDGELTLKEQIQAIANRMP